MSEPFLPVEEKHKQRTNARKTLVLWLLLIVMFISIYQLLAGAPASS
jgi:hypothetical protein